MKELLAKIQSLPKLALSARETDLLAEIMRSANEADKSDERNKVNKIGNLEKQLNTYANEQRLHFEHETVQSLLGYFTIWFEIGELLLQWNTFIKSVFSEFKPDALLAADQLTPLTIELLPSNKAQLKALLLKLTEADQFSFSGEEAYYLLTLRGCVQYKIGSLAEKHPSPPDAEQQEIRVIGLFEHIKIACQDYQDHLIELFKQQCKVHDETTYFYIFANKRSEDDIMATIAETINNPESALWKIEELALIKDKYIAIADMRYTLFRRDIPPQSRIREFIAKFENHQHSLQKKLGDFSLPLLKKYGPYVGLSQLNTLFQPQRQEAQFISLTQMLMAVCRDIHEPSINNAAAPGSR